MTAIITADTTATLSDRSRSSAIRVGDLPWTLSPASGASMTWSETSASTGGSDMVTLRRLARTLHVGPARARTSRTVDEPIWAFGHHAVTIWERLPVVASL